MLISMILPSYNNIEYVDMTLKALSKQKYDLQQLEILLVDDGSKVPLKNLTNLYDLPIRVIEKEHSGRARTRNVGIRNAKGDILLFMDSDMIVGEDFLQKHHDKHANEENDIVLGNICHIPFTSYKKVKDIVYSTSTELSEIEDLVQRDVYLNLAPLIYSKKEVMDAIGWICCLFSNCSVKRKVVEKSGLFDSNFVGWGLEDIEIGYRFFKNNFKFVYDESISNYHVDHATDKDKMLADMSRNLKLFYKKHPDNAVRHYMSFVAGFMSVTELVSAVLDREVKFEEGNYVYFKPINYVNSKTKN